MTKLNKNFESLAQYTCREFDIKETVTLLILTNPSIWGSWGVEPRIINYNDKGLLLKVNGNHWKQFVFITLSGADLYDVYLVTSEYVITKEMKDIFFEDLQARIDVAIERISDYNF